MRLSVAATCLSLCLIGVSTADDAHASIRKETNIPAEGLGPALNALAMDRNFQIVYVTEEIANVRTEGAVGELTTEEALERLLTGTGLPYRYLDEKTVTIGSATPPLSRVHGASKAASSQSSDDANANNQEGKKRASGEFRVAQVDQRANSQSYAVGNNPSTAQETSTVGLEEIVVTAQKREERLQDAPVAITALTSAELSKRGATQLSDYVALVPGLNLLGTGTTGQNELFLRGITAGVFTNPTVGVYVDDVPYGSSSGYALGGYQALDLFPFDIAQIEVLKGPQGTLYGANALGGLLKYTTNPPDLSGFAGLVEVDGSKVAGGASGGGGKGMVNLVLLPEKVALRVSAYYEQAPGWLRNVGTAEESANQASEKGVRATLLIAPDEKWSIKLGALLQNISTDGTNYELVNPASHQPLYGDLTQSSIIHEPFNGQYRLYTSSIKWDNPIGQAVSETSYSSLNALGYRDFSIPFGLPSSQTYGTFTHKWTQEFRLVTPSDRTVQWTTGIFYTSEESGHPQDYENIPVQSTPLLAVVFPSAYREYAIYADPTWHITPALDLTLGGRWSDISQHFSVVESGAFVGPLPLTASGPATNRVWNWLVNPSYHLNTDTLLYVRVATGFQPGGANIVLPGENVPPVFYPDTTINYEVGVKSEFLERRALLNVAVFDIEWHHIQLLQQFGSFTAFGNAGNARSKGVELSATYIPISNLTLAASGAYTEAFLTTAAPGVGGAEGSALPNVPRWSGSLSADYSVPLTTGIKGFAGATVRMEGERHAYFPDSLTAGGNTPFELGAFSALDLRAGLTKDVWQVELYGKNVTDRRGELSVATLGPTQPASLILLQPRTVGIKLSRTF